MADDFQEYPKMIYVDGAKFEARDAEHEAALRAGESDPQVAAAQLAAMDAAAAEAKRAADEAVKKADDAAQAAKDHAKAAKAAPKAPVAKAGKKK